MTSLEGGLGSMLAELYLMADSSTTARRIQTLFAGGYWACRHLRNGIKDVSVASKPRILLTSLAQVLGSMLAELYSMADYSTTIRRIPILFAEGCWT